MKIINSILNLLIPNRCLHCYYTIASSDFLCSKCQTKLTPLPETIYSYQLQQFKFKSLLTIQNAYALFAYEKKQPIQSILKAIKYHNRPEISIQLITMFDFSKLFTLLKNVDIITIVPLHPKKEKKRGYNQVDLFGNEIALLLNKTYLKDLLIRTQNNQSQTIKNKRDRYNDVSNIFRANDNYQINHKHILLIDDVITTGATLENCVKAIHQKHQVKVSILSIACVL